MRTSGNKLAAKLMEFDSIMLRPRRNATGFELGKRKGASSIVFMNSGAKNRGVISRDADRWSKSKQKFSKGQKLTHVSITIKTQSGAPTENSAVVTTVAGVGVKARKSEGAEGAVKEAASIVACRSERVAASRTA
ncbi:hypothetical protein IV203_027964 [Nitzschia inconspicua]|uniref:Uncharacterized protein n=1 Tax=Nitzschia inconspicua TaxID=303405 RepID=A0A9K3LY91_9STRA|nr:hypothetical protein IV203_027964 [Nitzschia inconspicua]